MKIDVAYCIELNRVVDIQDACLEFSNQSTFSEFHFLCSDPLCRKSGVRVTAVNHHKSPEESNTFKSPHYRKLDEHNTTCEWIELENDLQNCQNDDSNSDIKNSFLDNHLLLKSKVTRVIKRFVIPDLIKTDISSEITIELDRIRNITDPRAKRQARLNYARGSGSTATNLESLVTCYEDLKNADALDETFEIANYGEISYRNAFRQVTLGPCLAGNFAVYYGGARLYKRYGEGFSLNFIDRIHDKTGTEENHFPISFYVSSDVIKDSRHGARLKRMIEQLEKNQDRRPYLRVYWIGDFQNDGKKYNVIFNNLSHVVMRIVYPVDK